MKKDIGEVDILINNAGIVTGKKFLDCSDHMIQKTFEVNTIAHFWVSIQGKYSVESFKIVGTNFSVLWKFCSFVKRSSCGYGFCTSKDYKFCVFH